MTERVQKNSLVRRGAMPSAIRAFWKRLFLPPFRYRKHRQRIVPGILPRTGNTIPLTALAPYYRPKYHEVYLDLLKRALRHPDTRNIALTGSYGSGKSSVLQALGRHWWQRRRIVELSLSTLDPDLVPPAHDQNPAELEKSLSKISSRIGEDVDPRLSNAAGRMLQRCKVIEDVIDLFGAVLPDQVLDAAQHQHGSAVDEIRGERGRLDLREAPDDGAGELENSPLIFLAAAGAVQLQKE